MAVLADSMPPIVISPEELQKWVRFWLADVNPGTGKAKKPNVFDCRRHVNFALFIDRSFANSLAAMLGGIPVVATHGQPLNLAKQDCVEIGNAGIIGGVRPQNFNVAYRPDGSRVAFDFCRTRFFQSDGDMGKRHVTLQAFKRRMIRPLND